MEDIVFVCTGNICRSPMAEYVFRARLGTGSGLRVSSAGVMAGYGIPASRFAVKVLEELGLDLKPHRSQPVMPQMAATAKLLVVMTRGHRSHLLGLYPEYESRIRLLTSFLAEGRDPDIMDPIGLSLDVYRYVRDEIAASLVGLEQYLRETQAVR